MKVAIVLNSGKKIKRAVSADKVICADGGIRCYDGTPDVFVGDFDSYLGEVADDVVVVKHNPHKDATDGTLSLEYAVEKLGADEIVLYGVTGGREDHVLGNYSLLAYAKKLGANAVAHDDGLDLYFADGDLSFSAKSGDLVSIVPFDGECVVAHSVGLEYPLENLTLTSYDTRGISNVAEGEVKLEVKSGKALVFHYVSED